MIRTFIAALTIGLAGIGAPAIANADGPYSNCTQAHDDGRWDIPQSDPDYWPGGDRDDDGYACDSPGN